MLHVYTEIYNHSSTQNTTQIYTKYISKSMVVHRNKSIIMSLIIFILLKTINHNKPKSKRLKTKILYLPTIQHSNNLHNLHQGNLQRLHSLHGININQVYHNIHSLYIYSDISLHPQQNILIFLNNELCIYVFMYLYICKTISSRYRHHRSNAALQLCCNYNYNT